MYVPFNHSPISLASGNGTYTCPSGKYSRIVISLGGVAYGVPGTAPSGNSFFSTSDSFKTTVEYWIKSGDVVTFSSNNASATSTSSVSVTVSATSSVQVFINSTKVSEFACTAVAGHLGLSVAAVATISGTTYVNWNAEEYNNYS